jgi:hypothetical protein
MKSIFFKIGAFLLITSNMFSQDFEVAPVTINFNAEPGQNQSIPVSITNHSNKKTIFTVSLSDFVINKAGERIQMLPATTENSLVNWISINPPLLEINPNETKQFLASIQAPVGDYSSKWAYIVIRTATEQTSLLADKNIQTGLNISGQILVRTIQSPRSNINYKIKIHSLQEIASITESSVRKFNVTIDNIGDKIANCRIFLLASNLADAKETVVYETKIESYPNTQQILTLQMPATLPAGKYSLAAIADYGNRNNLEGTQILIEVK